MKTRLSIALLFLACAACSQQDAPADEIVAKAEEIVAPSGAPAPLARGRYAPRDTCAGIDGAAAFRSQLARAVEERNIDLLVGLAASDIKLDFGGASGAAELGKRLADDSWNLWAEFDHLMAMGCAANSQGGITIPWVFEQDFGRNDPAMTMLVTGEDVPVRETPDAQGPRVAALSWDLVTIDGLQPDQPFQRVKFADGETGFIATDKLRSLLDYRLIASSRNGRWRITSFVAGD